MTKKITLGRTFMPSQSADPADIPGLNPKFLARHSIFVLDRDAQTLTVAMADPGNAEALAALRFATGRDVRAVPLGHGNAETAPAESPVAAGEPLVLMDEHEIDASRGAIVAEGGEATPSFFERFGEWIGGARGDPLGLASLTALMEAGFTPAEAADSLLRFDRDAATLPEATRDVVLRLAAGEPLDQVLSTAARVPAWLANAVAAAPSANAQSAALQRIVRLEDEFGARFDRARMALVELTLLWSVVVLAWALHSWSAAAIAALVGVWLSQRLKPLCGRTQASDLVRAHILEVTALLAVLKVAPRPAIRCAFARLAAFSPTWGSLPDTREDLAIALDLPTVQRLLFLRDDLSAAAARAAQECARRASASLERHRWVIRCAAAGLLALALAFAAVQ